MAEKQFPEYDKVGITDGAELLADLQKQLDQINKELAQGFYVSPNATKTDKRSERVIKLPQFSDAYNKHLDRRADIEARIPALQQVLKVKAAAWVAPSKESGLGRLASSKKEAATVQQILAAPVISAPAQPTGTPAPVKDYNVPLPAGVTIKAPVTTTTGTGTGTGTGAGTTGGSGKGKDKRKGKGVVTPVVNTAWEAKFKSQYPQYAWMFTDEMKGKYPDLFQLFQEASSDPEFDPNLFARRFDGSSWATELKTSQKGRQLTAAIGGLSWGSGNLGKFLTMATQMSWEGETLKMEAYKELFRKGADGKYVNDLAVGEVRASTPWMKLKRIGTQFFAPMDDTRIEESLTGGITSDDVLRLARERAKAMYPHLTAQIDAGLTLEDLAYDYKRIAAQTLELTPDQVDMSNAKFNKAMKTGEGGKERMMSTGEWEQLLRTDPQYGFSKTKQANRDAVDIGLQIARAFGKVG